MEINGKWVHDSDFAKVRHVVHVEMVHNLGMSCTKDH